MFSPSPFTSLINDVSSCHLVPLVPLEKNEASQKILNVWLLSPEMPFYWVQI